MMFTHPTTTSPTSVALLAGGVGVLSSLLTALLVMSWTQSALPSEGFTGTASFSSATPATGKTCADKSSRFLIDNYGMRGPVRWQQLSASAQDDFTLNRQVRVKEWFISSAGELKQPVWKREEIDAMVKIASLRNPNVTGLSWYGNASNDVFFQALDRFPVKGLSVLVVGSESPWVEAICISYGAGRVTTVDFNPPITDDERIRVLSIPQLDATTETFDAVFSFSSIEHDGLGRYADPINPNGDIERLRKLQRAWKECEYWYPFDLQGLVRPDGYLYLGVPMGVDALEFNAHRIYGPKRFPLLIQGWNLVATFGKPLKEAFKETSDYLLQPLHVLSLKQVTSLPKPSREDTRQVTLGPP